jgi:hypothetical protein
MQVVMSDHDRLYEVCVSRLHASGLPLAKAATSSPSSLYPNLRERSSIVRVDYIELGI